MPQSTIFFNCEFVPEEKAVVSIKTHALQYGTGCFEGIRAYYSDKEQALFAFRLADHYKRLEQSCRLLFITLPLSIEELVAKTVELLQKNFDQTDIYIRPFAYKADLSVGNFKLPTLTDGFAIYTVPLGRFLNTADGIKANISSWDRVSDNAIPPRAKIAGSYVNTSLAKTEAQLSGADEAILLDTKGHINEGSAENIFLIKNDTLITPPTSDAILVGITRDTIMHLAKTELHFQVVERSIARTEIYQADEAFMVGTGAEVTPIIEVDKRTIGNGKPGPITTRLKDIYFQLVHGELPNYSHWVTKITEEK